MTDAPAAAAAEPGLARFPPGTARGAEGGLLIGGCDAGELAAEFGTPLLAYDTGALRARARRFRAALASALPGREAAVAFASKACPCPPVLAVLAAEGLRCDVASAGEVAMARAGGFAGRDLVLHGNAKRNADLAAALEAGAGLIVIDGPDDADRLERLGARAQPVLVRIVPDVAAATHPAMQTGHLGTKFGVPLAAAPAMFERLRASAATDLQGVHVHLGSQILDLSTFTAGVEALAALGPQPVVDVGGGLGIAYRRGDEAPTPEAWAAELGAAIADHAPAARTVIAEPGRSLVGPAAVTLYRVVTVKRYGAPVVAVDGGLSDNLEPIYGVAFDAVHADRPGGQEPCRLVGHHCEEGDTLGQAIPLDDPRPGDLLAVPVTGAYTFTMANNYNATPRPAVVLAERGEATLAVRRETLEDLAARFA
ncbi:MAG: diaminopimelate decarboxylase [Solirubrobacteraceae bacterium]